VIGFAEKDPAEPSLEQREMLNTDPLATKPFRGPVPWRRGIDRLELVPAGPTGATTASTAPLAPEEAVARLTAAGLACRRTKATQLHILGGASVVVDGDIHGYVIALLNLRSRVPGQACAVQPAARRACQVIVPVRRDAPRGRSSRRDGAVPVRDG